jgi:hypothetical protein
MTSEVEPEKKEKQYTNERWELIQRAPASLSSKTEFHLFHTNCTLSVCRVYFMTHHNTIWSDISLSILRLKYF